MEKRPFPSYLPSGYLTSSSSFTSISLDIGPGFVIRHSDKEELTVGDKKQSGVSADSWDTPGQSIFGMLKTVKFFPCRREGCI